MAAWGPSYFGPGNRSVTADTGQTVTHIPHLMHRSSVVSTGRWTGFAGGAWIGSRHRATSEAAAARPAKKPCRHSHPVQRVLADRLGAGEETARHRDVVPHHLAGAVEGSPSAVDLDPGAVDGVPGRVEDVPVEPVRSRGG